ncbi:hypothetical protein CPHO_10540 [Corynebacterium phocae]|uniref:Uncharacterized protein n=1 Tax=Corynebacterium phocae TaxID=161895 RepID=A0A1L7D544_9CORY|nr:hypothetical protein CPHO_10540 [Corynebacterium phocae]
MSRDLSLAFANKVGANFLQIDAAIKMGTNQTTDGREYDAQDRQFPAASNDDPCQDKTCQDAKRRKVFHDYS